MQLRKNFRIESPSLIINLTNELEALVAFESYKHTDPLTYDKMIRASKDWQPSPSWKTLRGLMSNSLISGKSVRS